MISSFKLKLTTVKQAWRDWQIHDLRITWTRCNLQTIYSDITRLKQFVLQCLFTTAIERYKYAWITCTALMRRLTSSLKYTARRKIFPLYWNERHESVGYSLFAASTILTLLWCCGHKMHSRPSTSRFKASTKGVTSKRNSTAPCLAHGGQTPISRQGGLIKRRLEPGILFFRRRSPSSFRRG